MPDGKTLADMFSNPGCAAIRAMPARLEFRSHQREEFMAALNAAVSDGQYLLDVVRQGTETVCILHRVQS